MAADCQAGRAEGGGGYVARGTDAYRTAGVAAVDLELDRPGWRAGAGVADADGGGEGERLPEYGRVGRRDQHRAGLGDGVVHRLAQARRRAGVEIVVATVGDADAVVAHAQLRGGHGGLAVT